MDLVFIYLLYLYLIALDFPISENPTSENPISEKNGNTLRVLRRNFADRKTMIEARLCENETM